MNTPDNINPNILYYCHKIINTVVTISKLNYVTIIVLKFAYYSQIGICIILNSKYS